MQRPALVRAVSTGSAPEGSGLDQIGHMTNLGASYDSHK